MIGGGKGAACADDGTVTEEELETGEGIVIGVIERIAWADDDTVSAEPEMDAEGTVIRGAERTAWADDGTCQKKSLRQVRE